MTDHTPPERRTHLPSVPTDAAGAVRAALARFARPGTAHDRALARARSRQDAVAAGAVHRPECRASRGADPLSALDQAEIAVDALSQTIRAVRLLQDQGSTAPADHLRDQFPQLVAAVAHALGLDEHRKDSDV